MVNDIVTGARYTLRVQYCTKCCKEQSDIRNTVSGLQECTEIIYMHETMRKLYKLSFDQCLLKLEVQAIGDEGVERSKRLVCREARWLGPPWRMVEFLDICQGALSLETTSHTDLSSLWSVGIRVHTRLLAKEW